MFQRGLPLPETLCNLPWSFIHILYNKMNLSSPNTKKLLIALVVVIILAGAGYYFVSMGGSVDSVANVIIPVQGDAVGADILVLADKLKSISIDPSVFSGPLFSNLQDKSVPLNPESVGRENPFAQFEGSFAPTSSSGSKKGTTSKP